MVLSDTTNRENGLIQRCEDNCGLGATGISGNTELLSKFIGWLNQWNKMAADYAIKSWDGADFDDKQYTTKPSGTFTGTTNRDYNFDSAYKLLKIKLINVTYTGLDADFVVAEPLDMQDKGNIASKNSNVDYNFSQSSPKFDERANGFDLYPKFTSAQVSAGAKVYVEWFRAPRDFASTGTDSYEPCVDLQFHHFPAVGASYEYCKLYKPEVASKFEVDIYGNNANIPGLKKEIEEWYSSKSPDNCKIRTKYNNPR